MDVNTIQKNIGTFANAYGLNPHSSKLVEFLEKNVHEDVKSIGILLRDPVTKKGFVSCRFPVEGDHTASMLWIPINDKNLEAVPLFSRYTEETDVQSGSWKRLKNAMSVDDDFDVIGEGDFMLMVHNSFRTKGVIEKYLLKNGYGFISRNRKGIFFMSKWCDFDRIEASREVSFIPVISRKGLQARAVSAIES